MTGREDRILVRDGRRHHRRTYSRTEFRVGLAALATLALILVWVGWRGANPDPELFGTGEDLLAPPAAGPVDETDRRLPSVLPPSSGTVAPAAAVDRGPLPGALAAPGWREGPISTFGWDNLYEKIDGREGFYKSLGFERLWFVSLLSEDDPATSVDIEAYDLGEAANALGAYAGERPQGGEPKIGEEGVAHLDRNTLVLARGRFYIRAIGSDETGPVREQLLHVQRTLESGLPGEPLPWAYALFVGRLGLDPGQISYMPENAFSFGFAREVYAALLADETEMFVVAPGGAAAAAALVKEFTSGFRSYGSAVEGSSGVEWTKDRYIGTVAGAKAVGPWTVGIRGAPDVTSAEAALRDLEQAVRELPEDAAR